MNDSKTKYYYKDSSGQTQGAFSERELKNLNLDQDTLIWHIGMTDWVALSTLFTIQTKQRTKTKFWIWIVIGVAAVASLWLIISSCSIHGRLRNNSYASDEFDMYLNKYYRDLEVFGISVVKSRNVSIRLASMQYFKDTKDYYGIAFGYDDDNLIEIYINEDEWNKLTRAQKYLLMYHELSHDILNVDDLPNTPENASKLMSPILNRYEKLTMDDFIEMTHEFFIEQSPIFDN